MTRPPSDATRPRVVIAEDSVVLREGLVGLLERAGLRRASRAVGDADGPAGRGRRRPARRHRGRHPHAADPHRRGPAGRHRAAPPASVGRGAGVLAVRRDPVRRRAAGRPVRRGRLPAQGPGRRTSASSSTPCAGSSAAAPPSTPRWSSQLLAAPRRTDGLAALTPREREVLALMAEGRTNAAIAVGAGRDAAGGREARGQHLHEARPARVGRRPPPGARRPALAALVALAGGPPSRRPPRSRARSLARQ